MKRNSAILYLQSPGSITPLPWIDNAPDFSAFTEPTLSVLQQAWTDFLNSGEELEIISDPEPIPEPVVPNWPAFNFYLFSDSDFIQYGLALQAVNPYLVPALVERYGQIAKVGLAESDFASYWNYFCQLGQVTSQHRGTWADSAESLDLPAEFVAVVRG